MAPLVRILSACLKGLAMFFKICGMTRQKDLDIASELGFAIAGFIFHARSPRNVAASQVRALDTGRMLRAGVFVEQGAGEILETVEAAHLDLVQVHGKQDAACLKELAGHLGKERILRVAWPETYAARGELLAFMEACAQYCGMVLLDAGYGGGGHGTGIPASMIQDLSCTLPWMLAGGLTRDSLDVVQAMPEKTRPAGLDFNSGLESAPGYKDEALMRDLVLRAVEYRLGPDMPALSRLW